MNAFANGVFFLYYGLLFFFALLFYKERIPSKYQRAIFFILSVPLLLFVVFRPLGIMRDDVAYDQRFYNLCETDACEFNISNRDPLWNFLVSIGKFIINDPLMMLLVSGIALCIKLFVIYKICHKLALALFVYVGLFYQLHDLTQLRISLAVSFLMLFFYFFLKVGINKKSLVFLIASGLTHNQAIAGGILLFQKAWRFKYCNFILMSVGLLVLMTVGFYPKLDNLSEVLSFFIGDIFLYESIDMYITRAEEEWYAQNLVVPLIFYFSMAAYLVLINDVRHSNFKLAKISALSLLGGIFFAFLFTSISDVQVRMYEYFSIVGVLLAGNSLRAISFWVASGLSFLYFAKYNIFWSIWDFSRESLIAQ